MPYIADGQPWQPPEEAADVDYAKTPPAGGGLGADLQAFGAMVQGTLQEAGRDLLTNGSLGGLVPPAYLPGLVPNDPIIQPDEANKTYAPGGTTLFTHPVPQSVAKAMGKEASDQAQRDNLLSRWAAEANPLEQIGIPLAAGLLDPTNLAAAFVPGLGEEAFLARLGKAGFTGFGARVAARAASGGATFAALGVPSIVAQSIHSDDFDLRDSLRQLALDAPVGGILHIAAAAR